MTKFQYFTKMTAVGTMAVTSLPMILNDSESILPNLLGIALLAVGGYLYKRWHLNDYDKSDYSNEYFPNEQ